LGEPLTFSSFGAIKVNYSGSFVTKAITAEMIDDIDINIAVEQAVTVTYAGKTDGFKVTLTERPSRELDSISVKTAPVLASGLNQILQFASYGKLTLTYSDNSTGEVDIAASMLDLANVDIFSAALQSVTITYLGKQTSFSFTLTNDLNQAKTAAIAVINAAYAEYEADYGDGYYTELQWGELTAAKNKGIEDVTAADNVTDINRAKNLALSTMALVPDSSVSADNPFTTFAADYAMSMRTDGTVSVTWTQITNAWQFLNNAQDLNHDPLTANIYAITVENTGAFDINILVNLNAALDGIQVGTSAIISIPAGTTRTVKVRPVEEVETLYIFIDCNQTHSKSGGVILSDFGFKYDSAYSTASEFTLADYLPSYTLTDKDGVLANFAYADLQADKYEPVFYNLPVYRAANNQINIGVTNNGTSTARVLVQGGVWKLDGSGLLNYIDQHTSGAYGGVEVTLAPGETLDFAVVVDYDGTVYPGADPVPADAVLVVLQFNLDCCWWDDSGTTRTGNIDIIYINATAYSAG
jgi:hypothetical protein